MPEVEKKPFPGLRCGSVVVLTIVFLAIVLTNKDVFWYVKRSGYVGLAGLGLGTMLLAVSGSAFVLAQKRWPFLVVIVGALVVFGVGLTASSLNAQAVVPTHSAMERGPTPEEQAYDEQVIAAPIKATGLLAGLVLLSAVVGLVTRPKVEKSAST